MDASAVESRPTLPAPGPGSFRRGQASCWLALCVTLGCLAAWAAAVAQRYHPPFLLFSVMAGGLLGGALVGLLRVFHVGHRPTAVLGAVLAGSLAVAGQHYVVFLLAHENLARNPQVYLAFPEKLPPDRFWEFMRWDASRGRVVGSWQARGAWAWATWGAEGFMLLVPTVLLVYATARLPYCDQCRKWYHTTRSGRIDADAAWNLAALVDATGRGTFFTAGEGRVRYRLISCPGGCGPTGLSLAWGRCGEEYCSTGLIWLSPSQRDQVQQLLDAAIAKRQAESKTSTPQP